MADDHNDVRVIARNAAQAEVSNYIKTMEFQKAVDIELEKLISKFEGRAKFWAGLAATLFFLVFSAAMGWQLLEAKQKQAELSTQYAAASELASRLRITIDDFKSKAQRELSTLDIDIKNGIGSATGMLTGLKTQVDNLKNEIDAVKMPSKQ